MGDQRTRGRRRATPRRPARALAAALLVAGGAGVAIAPPPAGSAEALAAPRADAATPDAGQATTPTTGCIADAAPGEGSPVRIMPLGDSITIGMHGTGADWRRNKSLRGGYRARLQEALDAAGARYTMVGSSDAIDWREGEHLACLAHEGHGGWCLQGGAGRCRADRYVPGGDAGIDIHVAGWLEAHEPDVVLLHIGTNDLGAGRSIDELARDHEAFLAQIFELRPRLVVLVSSLHLARRPDVNTTFNERLREIVEAAAATGHRARFVDTYACAPAPVTGDDANGLHPSLATYEVMGERWAQALLEAVPELGSAAPDGPAPPPGDDGSAPPPPVGSAPPPPVDDGSGADACGGQLQAPAAGSHTQF